MTSRLLTALITLAAAAGCAQPPKETPPPYKPVTSVLELMEGPVAHAAEVYWDSVATTVDPDGVHERFPKDDEEWEGVWASAVTIAESGNLLMMPPRAKDSGDWMKLSAAMIDAGMEAAKAAQNKDREQVLEAGGRVYEACLACHQKYVPGTRQEP